MLEAHGLFQLTARSETYRSDAQLVHRNATPRAANPAAGNTAADGMTSPFSNPGSKSAVTLPAGVLGSSMQDFWQRAADKAAQRLPSAETIKKLQTASKSDNQDIAAQKMQQAKAKLQALRLQAQLAAASSDKQQLRRLAQEVAAAAHEVASAAHDLAEGVVASVTDTGGTSVPMAATGDSSDAAGGNGNADNAALDADGSAGDVSTAETTADAPAPTAPAATAPTVAAPGVSDPSTQQHLSPADDKPTPAPGTAPRPIYAQQPPTDGDPFAWGHKALNSLATDAGNAIAQARGLLAFLATAARSKRKSGDTDNDDRFFSELQRAVNDAQGQVNSDIADADAALLADQGIPAGMDLGGDLGAGVDTGSDSVLGIDTVTVTQVTTTAVFLNITT